MAEGRRPARQHTTVLVAVLVGLMALITGCASGDSQISAQVTGGSGGRVGGIVVRDAMFNYHGPIAGDSAYRPGDTVSVQATIVNDSAVTDRLVSVSSPIAAGGIILGTGTIAGHHALAAGNAEPVASVSLPDTSPLGLRLTDLNTAIRSGLTYPVVFTFARAGQLRLQLRVQDPDQPQPDCPLPPDGKPPLTITAPVGRAPIPPTSAPPDCSTLR